jgi:hypothetical protein
MESELEHITSDMFDKVQFEKQLQIIKKASEMAQAKIDYDSAHDDHILLAIRVIENFLRKKHRICYGGQAINAYLPAKYKFYNPEYSIPDYDFFTPSQHEDIRMIVTDLKKAGFTEISVREGMHEGTLKVYVDYIPVADLTVIDPKLYRMLSKREFRTDGISYLDASTLRMLMYLELSRPRGEVRRWDKVFERLMLFNEFVPIRSCYSRSPLLRNALTQEQIEYTIHFVIQNQRVFAGADLLSFYEQSYKKKLEHTKWILSQKKPILFFSSNALADANTILAEFKRMQKKGDDAIQIQSYHNKGVELIPSLHILYQKKQPLVFIIEQSACHSYFNVQMKDNKVLQIASMDTLITLYFSLGFIQSKFFNIGSMECLANQLVQLNIYARSHPDQFYFPFVSLECSGHQSSLPSLIRSKVKRITAKKKELKKVLEETNGKLASIRAVNPAVNRNTHRNTHRNTNRNTYRNKQSSKKLRT